MPPYALPSGDGKATWFLNTLAVEKAGAEQTGGAFSLPEQTLPPPTAPDFQRLTALGKKYRFDILGPLPG